MTDKFWEIRAGGNRLVAAKAVAAESFRMRLCGMIGKRFVPGGFDAMFFRRCGSIHTWWMGCAIDVLFIDRNDVVVSQFAVLKPWRLAFGGRGAAAVIELPAGKLQELKIANGEKLSFSLLK